jgi:hypothetical protein
MADLVVPKSTATMIRLFRACSGCIWELTVNIALGENCTAGQVQ